MSAHSPSPVTIRPDILSVPAYRQGSALTKPGFKLSSNENPFSTLPVIQEAVAAAPINRYAGTEMVELRAAIGALFGLDTERSQTHVHLGAGSVSILYQLIQAVCGPEDNFVFAWPSFEGYPLLGLASGAKAVRVPLNEASEHDLGAMADAITPSTRAVLLCSPNNPTGPAMTRDAFERFMERVPEGVLVVLDEAYRELVTDPDAVRGEEVLANHENLVVLRTFSKAYGLASLRLGYGVGHPGIWAAARITGIPLSITAQAEAGALAALGSGAQHAIAAQVAELVARRTELVEGLREQGYDVPETQGNFVWIPLGDAAASFAEHCAAEGTLVRAFPGEGVRITVGEPESVAEVLRLAEAFRRTERQEEAGR